MKAWFTILPSYERVHFKDAIASLEDELEEQEDKEQRKEWDIAKGTTNPGVDYFNQLVWFGLVKLV